MSLRRSALLLAGASALALTAAAPALAQSVLPGPPPRDYTLDARGVDLVSGAFTYTTTEVAIGQPGQGGLAYTRTFTKGGWRDNLTGTIVVQNGETFVSLGPVTESFTVSGGVYTPTRNTGSTLTGSGYYLTYTKSDGMKAFFAPAGGGYNPIGNVEAWVQNITHPNGETWGYTYAEGHYPPLIWNPEDPYAVRLDSVTSNTGYMLKFEYVVDEPQYQYELGYFTILKGVQSLNMAVDVCTAGYNVSTCSGLTQNWPRVSYTWPIGNQEVVTDQSGRATTYTFVAGNIGAVRAPGATVDDFTVAYLGPNLSVSSFARAGSTWTYGYSDVGSTRTLTTTDPSSNTTIAISNQTQAVLTSYQDETGALTQFTYDSQDRLINVVNPEGDAYTYDLDARGNTQTLTWSPKSGSGLSPIVTSAVYPSSCASISAAVCNKPTSTTDARGNVTDYTWNATHGGIETITQPAPTTGAARPQTRYAYAPQTAYYKNGLGVIVASPSSVTLPIEVSQCATGTSCDGLSNEVLTTVQYGSTGVANNLLPTVVSRGSGTNPAITTTTSTWTPNGDLATVDGPLTGTADTTQYRYDDARQMTGMIGPDPDAGGSRPHVAQRMTYDARGDVTRTELGTVAGYSDPQWAAFSAQQKTEVDYDAWGRPVVSRATSAAGAIASVEQVSYDSELRVDCTTTRMNTSAWSSLPTSACTAQTPGADGPDRIVQTTYDAANRPLTATSALGQTEAVTTSVTYTANGQVSSMTDGNGNVSVQEYDGFDRPSKLRYPNPTGGGTSTTDYTEVAYDAASNPVSQRNRAGQTTTITYDALNRPTLIDAPSGTMDVSTAYDNLSRPLTRAGNSQTLTFTYDPLSRMTQETGPFGNIDYQYDLAGRVTQIASPGSYTAAYDRDVPGAILAIRSNGATSGPGVLAQYAYDNLGRQTGLTRGNGVTSAQTYDAFGRMTGLSHDLAGSANDVAFAYTYNPAGQIATRTVSNTAYAVAAQPAASYAHDGLNRMTALNSSSLGYDANQNLTTGLATPYAYDAANRLVSAGSSTLIYDPADRLFRSTGDGRRFQYSGAQLVAEYTDVDAMKWRYVSGGLDDTVAQYSGSDTSLPYWPIADERGTVIALTDGAGARYALNTYDEYGVPTSGNTGRMQYTGQMWLNSASVYHYRARAYAPGIGRFLQSDPIGYEAGMNLYAYVGADPINLIDPLGLQSCSQTGPNGPGNPGNITCVGGGKSSDPTGPGIFHRFGTAAGLPQNGTDFKLFEPDLEPVIVTASRQVRPPPRRRGGRRPVSPGQEAINIEWHQVVSQIRRYDPNYTTLTGPNPTQQDLNAARQILARHKQIWFSTNHYINRHRRAGIDTTAAESAVRSAIANTGNYSGTVFVNGRALNYRAFRYNGIHVGTIHEPY